MSASESDDSGEEYNPFTDFREDDDSDSASDDFVSIQRAPLSSEHT